MAATDADNDKVKSERHINDDGEEGLISMVSHKTVDNAVMNNIATFVAHEAVNYVHDEKDVLPVDDDEDNENIEVEDAVPITYTFTFGDNIPIIVKANDDNKDVFAVNEDRVQELVTIDGITEEESILDATNEEDADVVALPISSKFVVNFQKVSEEELPIKDDIKDEAFVKDGKEGAELLEKPNNECEDDVQTENRMTDVSKSSKVPMKTKIFNLLFGCFSKKKNK